MEIDESKDYSSAGATEDILDAPIDSEEQLNAYLNNGTETGAPTLEELEEAAGKEDATDEQKLAAVEARASVESPPAGENNTKPGDTTNDGKSSEETDEEFNSTLDYLNKTHELGLNMDDIPADLTREQEAEAISNVIGRMVSGVNSQVRQYEDVREILQDKEVADFIKAKSEGRTMADFVQQYASTPNGLNDEALVTDELKVKLPHLSEEDINTQVQSMKDRDKLTEFASKVRDERNASATEAEEIQKNNVLLQQQQQEQRRITEINDFGKFVQDKKDIYGIPLNTDMKKQIFNVATQIDKEGETYLEKALQSNEGVLLATAGLLHMERLMKGYASLDVNQRKKSFMDTLFDTPDALQSASSEHNQKGFDVDAANQF